MDEKILVMRSSMPSYDEYIEAIKPLWNSRWITNMGYYHKELEEKLKKYLNVPEVSLMVNGHMALEMTIQAFDFPDGSEIITTPYTFISTTHAIVRNNLCPVFCDVKETDGTIDETKIESLITDKTVAILPVHVYGKICNVEAIQAIADRHNLKVIYDAAHAFGEQYKGIDVGNFGDATVFSFHATKVFNTIEGGAVTFLEHNLYEKLYNLKNFGIRGEDVVETVGANAKMNEFCAIMGLCNLKHIDEVISIRGQKYNYYLNLLKDQKGLLFFEDSNNIRKNFAYLPVLVSDDAKCTRDILYEKLHDHNIYARKYFYPLTCNHACFQDKVRKMDLTHAEYLASRILVLPLYEELREDQIEYITAVIKKYV